MIKNVLTGQYQLKESVICYISGTIFLKNISVSYINKSFQVFIPLYTSFQYKVSAKYIAKNQISNASLVVKLNFFSKELVYNFKGKIK